MLLFGCVRALSPTLSVGMAVAAVAVILVASVGKTFISLIGLLNSSVMLILCICVLIGCFVYNYITIQCMSSSRGIFYVLFISSLALHEWPIASLMWYWLDELNDDDDDDADKASAIRCYTCSSLTSSHCSDPEFRESSIAVLDNCNQCQVKLYTFHGICLLVISGISWRPLSKKWGSEGTNSL